MYQSPAKSFWKKHLPTVILSVLIIGLGIWFIPSSIFPVAWDFRNNLWGPAYLLFQGMSPFDIKVLFDISNAIWMPMLVGLLSPIGLIPLQWASNLWLLFNLASLALIVSLIARPAHKAVVWIPITFLLLAIFPASLAHFALGQVSLIICLIFIILIFHRNRFSPLIIGFLLCISLTKPQLSVLFLPAYLLIYFREYGIRQLIYVVASLLMWALISSIPLFILYPGWINDFLVNLSSNNTWFYPSLYSFILTGSGSQPLAVGLSGLFLCIGLVISVWLLRKQESLPAFLWIMAITPIFSPIIWSWDFVLIYPLIIYMAYEKKTKASSWMLFSGYGLCAIFFFTMRINRVQGDQYTFWVPIFLNLVLILSFTLRNKSVS